MNARHAVFNLPVSFLMKLCEYFGLDPLGRNIFAIFQVLTPYCIPAEDLTDELWAEIFNLRAATFEYDEDFTELGSMKYILDCFDKMERTTLAQEIKTAKSTKSEHDDYIRAVCE